MFICCDTSWKAWSVSSFKWVASHVNSAAAADRFETRTEGGFFQLLGILRFKKMINPCAFRLALSLWKIITVWLAYHECVRACVCVCRKFCSWFTNLSNVIRYLLRIRTSILAAVNLWDIKKTLWVNNRLNFVTLIIKNILIPWNKISSIILDTHNGLGSTYTKSQTLSSPPFPNPNFQTPDQVLSWRRVHKNFPPPLSPIKRAKPPC